MVYFQLFRADRVGSLPEQEKTTQVGIRLGSGGGLVFFP